MKTITGTCQICRRGFSEPMRSGSRRKYCPQCVRRGDARAVAYKRQRRVCPVCARGFTAKTMGTTFCSEICARWGGYDLARFWNAIRLMTSCPLHWRPCPDCGVDTYVGRNRSSRHACPTCTVLRRRERDRRKNIKRRHAKVYELSLVETAKRDGYRCHICSGKVDMSLSGMHAMGPTPDHLIPVSAGGDSSASNVRLAHRHCNVSRGTGGTVQLLLVG